MVKLAKSSEETVWRQGKKTVRIHMESLVPDISKVTTARKFCFFLIHGYWTLKSLQALLTKGKLIFLAKALYLYTDKKDYFH
jgi:hypothetical protein